MLHSEQLILLQNEMNNIDKASTQNTPHRIFVDALDHNQGVNLHLQQIQTHATSHLKTLSTPHNSTIKVDKQPTFLAKPPTHLHTWSLVKPPTQQ